ncbi:MAG: hypothetical protein WA322_05755 [Pseudolabrys sp.]
MKMTVCASAIALAMSGLLSNVAPAHAREITTNAEMTQSSASINIARIKSALKLTPTQEPYWAPVEAALRDLNRHQAQSEGDGLVRRISHRVVSIALNSATIQKLAVAARPLIGVLDAEQMRTAHGLAQEMGLGPVVAALR